MDLILLNKNAKWALDKLSGIHRPAIAETSSSAMIFDSF